MIKILSVKPSLTKDIIKSCPPPNNIGDIIPTTAAQRKGIATLISTGTFFSFPYISWDLSNPLLNIIPEIPTKTPIINKSQ